MQSQSLRQRCRPPTPSPPITCITTAGLSNSPPCSLDGCICAKESRHISVLRLVFALGVFMETLWQDENTNPRLGSTKQKKKKSSPNIVRIRIPVGPTSKHPDSHALIGMSSQFPAGEEKTVSDVIYIHPLDITMIIVIEKHSPRVKSCS